MQDVSEQTPLVLVDHPRPGVALVTLNRPERMNSMAFDVMVPLKAALDEVNNDNTVRAVVLTGAGRGFSSGADHKSAGSVPHVAGLTRPTGEPTVLWSPGVEVRIGRPHRLRLR